MMKLLEKLTEKLSNLDTLTQSDLSTIGSQIFLKKSVWVFLVESQILILVQASLGKILTAKKARMKKSMTEAEETSATKNYLSQLTGSHQEKLVQLKTKDPVLQTMR